MWNISGQTEVEKEEKIDLRHLKNISCVGRKNIWNTKQNTTDIKEKLENQEDVVREWINVIYLFLSNKW